MVVGSLSIPSLDAWYCTWYSWLVVLTTYSYQAVSLKISNQRKKKMKISWFNNKDGKSSSSSWTIKKADGKAILCNALTWPNSTMRWTQVQRRNLKLTGQWWWTQTRKKLLIKKRKAHLLLRAFHSECRRVKFLGYSAWMELENLQRSICFAETKF